MVLAANERAEWTQRMKAANEGSEWKGRIQSMQRLKFAETEAALSPGNAHSNLNEKRMSGQWAR